ncbi:glutathione transferase GST 23 [Canna indica]|uniref:Glutathione transferase GST 23 n=1 Tax=Canna indica TaxID=4628 RepID=A0AAQ3QIL3_9LILI|nr:glutathione transferase GST 23 [Canna indica]
MVASGECREATRKAFFEGGEDRTRAIEQLQECLRRLDEELKGKKFFGGEEIGFADLVAGWLAFWLGVSEEAACFKAVDAKKMPWFAAWISNFLQVPVIKDNLPPRDKAVEFFRNFRKRQLAAVNSVVHALENNVKWITQKRITPAIAASTAHASTRCPYPFISASEKIIFHGDVLICA